MRWFWVDRFIGFKPGKSATAVKNVSLAEEHVHDHFPGYPVHPQSLMIEGMAQTGGVLVGQAFNFEEKVILAKIGRATFHRLVRPGDQIVYHAEVVDEIRPEGASIRGTITCDGQLVADIELMFVHLDKSMSGEDFGDDNFVFSADFVELLRMRELAQQFAAADGDK
ncbi:MAG TPA: 3-hydroxyacyl-ACP dehydratase FabZ family protein [Phycisphaerae bacterium]|nr:beta-hydroxyacyl-ACP dehydratase [Phycisphaerae bacterium]HOI55077.1 3-hydroxyacyl-ACP dehydratase FabZ family protein [Phycisphaerae bacterium]